eukprot:TRINITY_DN2167_c0_g1_i3.p1 TRINITY_DN2167_c0_g1~~TRINITY_DN2167_c0_g1_i3.p1  ORF type:complete len:112 (-),score=12.48 TRINITY_DN2167_c0_g1_i3:203-496(-)
MCTPLSTNPSATPQYNESFTASQYKEPLTIPQYTESPHQSQNPPKDDFDIQESCNQSVSFQHMLIFIFLRESFEGQKTLKFKLSPHSCALGHSLYLQ